MADQFVTMINSEYVVSVCYFPETGLLRSASFGAPAQVMEVTWNLLTMGEGARAAFNDPPIEEVDATIFQHVELLSPTQFRATVHGGDLQHIQPLRYVLSVTAGGNKIIHDPSIVVSPDPVEIPPR